MPPTAWHTEHGWQLPYAVPYAICHMAYACSTIYYVQVPTLCTPVSDPHLSLISMLCTMSLHHPTTWRRTAVTERSLRDAARMGWRWNRQLHPRQLKGTSSRTRIIAGVLLSVPKANTLLYACMSVLPSGAGMRRCSSTKQTAIPLYKSPSPAYRASTIS
jgi:hypothetical protein